MLSVSSWTEPVSPKSQDLKDSKGRGISGIQINLVKLLKDLIAPSPAYIFNEALKQIEFPFDIKHAKLSTLDKGGDRDATSNCRSIAVSSIFSNECEKLMSRRLQQLLL